MATIPLTGGFTICPTGEHVFLIYEVAYDKDFGKIEVKMINAQGINYSERFSLMRQDGTMNDKACNAFSFFAKTAMNDYSLESIEHTELVGHYIKISILHTEAPSTKDPSKMLTFANSGMKEAASGFDTAPCDRVKTIMAQIGAAPAAEPTNRPSLADLLG